MPSRREVILKQYSQIYYYGKENLPCDVFPSPLTVDCEDIVILLTHFFLPHYASSDYREVIQALCQMKGITVPDFETHYSKLQPMIHELCGLIKSF